MSTTTDQLESLNTLLNEFLDLLERERDALSRKDSKQLADTAEQKLELVAQVSQYDLTEMTAQISTLPDHERQECDALHSSVVKSAQAVRDSNLVNGMIVRRTQQSTSELLRILSGKPLNGLYGTTGEPVAGREATAATIAKA